MTVLLVTAHNLYSAFFHTTIAITVANNPAELHRRFLLFSMNLFRYGRKISLILAMIVKAVGTWIAIFSNSFEIFIVGRIVAGVGNSGCFLVSFVLREYEHCLSLKSLDVNSAGITR